MDVFRLDADEPPPATARSAGAALRLSVHNGNLKFVSKTLMVGHYGASTLTGTEAVVDRFIGGAMSASLALGLYPEAPGTHQFFINHRQDPDSPWPCPARPTWWWWGWAKKASSTVPTWCRPCARPRWPGRSAWLKCLARGRARSS